MAERSGAAISVTTMCRALERLDLAGLKLSMNRGNGVAAGDGHVAQHVGFQLHFVQPVFQHVTDTDEAGDFGARHHRQVADAALGHDAGDIGDAIVRRACDDRRRHHVGHDHGRKIVAEVGKSTRQIAF